jgi:hypothetical protein
VADVSQEATLWAEGVAQAIEFLPSKYKALSSNPSTAKKKKKKKEKKNQNF